MPDKSTELPMSPVQHFVHFSKLSNKSKRKVRRGPGRHSEEGKKYYV